VSTEAREAHRHYGPQNCHGEHLPNHPDRDNTLSVKIVTSAARSTGACHRPVRSTNPHRRPSVGHHSHLAWHGLRGRRRARTRRADHYC